MNRISFYFFKFFEAKNKLNKKKYPSPSLIDMFPPSFFFSYTMLHIILPFSIINISICTINCSFTMSPKTAAPTFVNIPIRFKQTTKAKRNIILPKAMVKATISKKKLADSMSESILDLSHIY